MKIYCGLLKNKKGSMMMDYFIIAAVGILLLGGIMMFLTGGRDTIRSIMGRANNSTESQDSLGTFF